MAPGLSARPARCDAAIADITEPQPVTWDVLDHEILSGSREGLVVGLRSTDGSAITGFTVSVASGRGHAARVWTATGHDGTATVHRVPAGEVRVLAVPEGGLMPIEAIASVAADGSGRCDLDHAAGRDADRQRRVGDALDCLPKASKLPQMASEGRGSWRLGMIAASVLLLTAGFLTVRTLCFPSADLGPAVFNPSPSKLPEFSESSAVAARSAFEHAFDREPVVELPVAPEDIERLDREGDFEWGQFPRRERPTAMHILMKESTKGLKGQSLYRHPELNPLDQHIDKRIRAQFDKWVSDRANYLLDIDVAYADMVTQEMNRLIALGHKKPLELNDSEAARAFMANSTPADCLPADVRLYKGGENIRTFYGVGRTLYGFSLADAPWMEAVVGSMAFARLDFATNVLNWFRMHGTLSDYQYASLIEMAHQCAEELEK